MLTELAPIERAKQALTVCATEAALAELAAKSRDIVTITNADGYQQVHGARMALKTMRVTIEKTGKAARDDATQFSKAVIAEEKRLIAIIEPEEQRLEGLQNAWEAARAAEKRAAEQKERDRLQAIETHLAKLRAILELCTSAMPSGQLLSMAQQLEQPPSFDYQERSDEATALREAAIVHLRAAHVEALEREEREEAERAHIAAEEAQKAAERAAEQKRLADERERLEADRKERERVAGIERQMEALGGPKHLTAADSPALIRQAIQTLEQAPIDERYAEFQPQAARIKSDGLDRLSAILLASETAQADRERLDAERREQEAMARAQKRIGAIATYGAHLTASSPVEVIDAHIATLKATSIDESYGELAPTARAALTAAIEHLVEVRAGAMSHRTDQQRLAQESADIARRQADIDRREREQREAEQARQVAIAAENARKEAAEALRHRISSLTAEDIVRWIASELGCEWEPIAQRLSEITRQEWLAVPTAASGSAEGTGGQPEEVAA